MKFSVKIAGIFAVVAFALTAVSADAAYTRDLTVGSTGADVSELQAFLNAKVAAGLPTTGYFGTLTKAAVVKWQASVGLPATGYFGKMSRDKIAGDTTSTGGSTTGSSDLSGGDGDVQSINDTTSGTETTLGEGKTEDVLGFDLEADDNSDLSVTSVKVEITTEAGASSRLSKYLDSVAVTLDGEEVGSVDASDFSRDGSVSTVTISLDKGTVVKAGEKARFYVTLAASDSINDAEQAATLDVAVTRIRVEDANGAVLTNEVDQADEIVPVTVDFEDAAANDDARIKSSSDSRDAGLLKVEANKKSEDFDILTFKFDVDEDSSDLTVLEIPVDLEIDNAGTALEADALVQDLWIEVDGEKYDDFDWESDTTIASGSTETVTATFTIDEGDLEIAAGDVVDAVVYVTLAEQDGNYTEGTTIKASVTGSAISAENADGDVFDLSGTVNGEVQTAQISAATVDNFKWVINNTGTIIDFFFTVSAEDEDFDVLASSIDFTVDETVVGTTTSDGTLSKSTGDADSISGGYRVLDGDTATFRVRYTLSGTNGDYSEVTMTSVAGQEIPDDKQVSPTATINVN
ncbi:MAG: trimeric autotransporter adhesin [Candidatus Parcubacteria bacterium]|jgi:peptidoglycan hydrolase-like protein with peptidoglycan-binding domain